MSRLIALTVLGSEPFRCDSRQQLAIRVGRAVRDRPLAPGPVRVHRQCGTAHVRSVTDCLPTSAVPVWGFDASLFGHPLVCWGCAAPSDEARGAAHPCIRFLRRRRKAEGRRPLHSITPARRRRHAISRSLVRPPSLTSTSLVACRLILFYSLSSFLLPRVDVIVRLTPCARPLCYSADLSRLHGLGINNLVEAEVVLAGGSIVIVNEKEHPGTLVIPSSVVTRGSD